MTEQYMPTKILLEELRLDSLHGKPHSMYLAHHHETPEVVRFDEGNPNHIRIADLEGKIAREAGVLNNFPNNDILRNYVEQLSDQLDIAVSALDNGSLILHEASQRRIAEEQRKKK